MNTKFEITVGIFKSIYSVLAFIDDRLIYLRNSERSRNIYLCCGDKETKDTTKKFLIANGFDLKESGNFLLVEFPDSTKESDMQHGFFLNTRYGQSEILEMVQKLLTERSESSTTLFIHLLNSDSYFGYYEKHKEKKDTRLIGSPDSPAKMENWDMGPF